MLDTICTGCGTVNPSTAHGRTGDLVDNGAGIFVPTACVRCCGHNHA